MSHLSTTALILERISHGETDAVNELAAHSYPMLLRWAHGRIPKSQKNLYETSDLVHETLMKGIAKSDQFNAAGTGAFLAYLRKIFINQINEIYRKATRRQAIEAKIKPPQFEMTADVVDFLAYEKALNQLSDEEQQAIILRIEFGMTHTETAEAMNKPSADAARMFTHRALLKLIEKIKK